MHTTHTPRIQRKPSLQLWWGWTLCLCLLALGMGQSNARAASGPDKAAALQAVAPVMHCEALQAQDLSDIGGAGSRVLTASVNTENGKSQCAVEGLLAPAIHFKLKLPMVGWTQRYLQVGCGGLCGSISMDAGAANGCAALESGEFAMASTDMGHQGMGGEFGRDTQSRADFAYRGVHLTALASKKLIQAFYGQRQAYAYFSGCSDGGREALMEAQRYPQDFNGIIAGAAAMNFQVQNGLYHAWQSTANTSADGKPVLTADRLPLLHRAVLAQCDALDGQRDGLIEDPRACHFDPKTLQCPLPGASPQSDCLSSAEVETIRKLYDGPRDPATGKRLTAGGPQPGSELSWAGVFVAPQGSTELFSTSIAMDALKNLVFEETPPASFTLQDLVFNQATFDKLRARHPLLDATNPDLSAFKAAGGKLILWHGWSDPHISPLNTIAYHEAVQTTLGAAQAAEFERLYLLPGVYHCQGGEGPSAIDLLSPMMDWVEQGAAPGKVQALPPAPRTAPSGFGMPKLPPGVAMPVLAPPASDLTATPVKARWISPYAGSASAVPVDASGWMGSDFFLPYTPRMR
ncbi:tannase/feruloyl esterase family alpha/beta hydrolase [Rhodoferax lacus]|nr:tannase/feruloyl esterase family alpha/beta hydrolase [Rhodoferax lacus]